MNFNFLLLLIEIRNWNFKAHLHDGPAGLTVVLSLDAVESGLDAAFVICGTKQSWEQF